jgi:hypothetical protein
MKKLFLAILLLSAFAAHAGEWIADNTTQCQVWNPFPKPEEAVKWTGACKDGKASGIGTLEWFKEGKANGTFQGTYLDGLRQGKGVFTLANGNRYDGDFLDDKRTGKGFFTWINGDKYEGDFVDGKRTGKGVITWPIGSRYEGDFVDDKRTGKGIMTWPSGSRYEGDFIDGKRTGKGILTYPNGDKYEGDFVDDTEKGLLIAQMAIILLVIL